MPGNITPTKYFYTSNYCLEISDSQNIFTGATFAWKYQTVKIFLCKQLLPGNIRWSKYFYTSNLCLEILDGQNISTRATFALKCKTVKIFLEINGYFSVLKKCIFSPHWLLRLAQAGRCPQFLVAFQAT